LFVRQRLDFTGCRGLHWADVWHTELAFESASELGLHVELSLLLLAHRNVEPANRSALSVRPSVCLSVCLSVTRDLFSKLSEVGI